MPSTSPHQLTLFPTAEPSPPVEPVAPPLLDAAPPVTPAKKSADFLLRRLRALRPGRFHRVRLTDNRSTIVSARETHPGLDVRIHRSFVNADDATLGAVAEFLHAQRRSPQRAAALAVIRDYFRQHQPPSKARRRKIVLDPEGRHLDLRILRDEINQRYFDGKLEVAITWGRQPTRRRRRGRHVSIRLGTYNERDELVRIHRCLDRAYVPRYVVESVVYHEMLHAAIPTQVVKGRRRIHTPEFRRRERLFPHYQRAERWIERHLSRLLSAR